MADSLRLSSDHNQRLHELCNSILAGDRFELEDIDAKGALFFAAQNNYVGVVDKLESIGLDVDITDEKGKTALFYANKNNCVDALCTLIRIGASFELEEIDAKAVLFFAAEHDEALVLEDLLFKGLVVNVTDDKGKTAVSYAKKNNCIDALCTLIRFGASFELEEIDAKAVLFFAAQHDRHALVLDPLYFKGLDFNVTDDNGKTALFYANKNNCVDALCTLIRIGASFELEEIDAKAVLFSAVQEDETKEIEILHSKGFDLNITDDKGKTAVFYANEHSCMDALCTLIKFGASFELEEIDAKAVLFFAAQHDHHALVLDPLYFKGLDFNVTDDNGKTALFYANKNNCIDALCTLICCGSSFELEEIDAKAALFHGAKENIAQILKPLSRAGFDLHTVDNEGKTVVFYAHEDFLSALTEFDEVLVNTRDVKGRTPLFYAVLESSPKRVQYLIDIGGNCKIKDNCNVNILSFFVQHCILNRVEALTEGLGKIELIQEQQPVKALIHSILDAVFCQAPLFSVLASHYLPKSPTIFKTENVLRALAFARKKCLNQDVSKIEKIKEISSMINSGVVNVERLLNLLIQLGANPSAADLNGNTAVHYAAILPLLGEPQLATTMHVLKNLRKYGASFNAKNHDGQLPLQFCLSLGIWKVFTEDNDCQHNSINNMTEVCKFLIRNGHSKIEDSELVFHQIISLIQHGLELKREASTKVVLQVLVDILLLLSPQHEEFQKAVNNTDALLNTPLHFWASITLKSPEQYTFFEEIMRTVLDHMLKCGAKLNRRNANDETPLHLCKTWTAAHLLLDSGANPNDLDSSGCSPLLVAFKDIITLKRPVYFSPNVSEELNTFWKNALEKGLDPWLTDKQGNSLLSVFIESGAFALAKALLEVACQENYATNDVKLSLLNVICRDESTHIHWKSNLVDIILKSSTTSHLPLEQPLRLCCENIVQFCQGSDPSQEPPNEEPNDDHGEPLSKKRKKDESTKDDERTDSDDKLINDDLVYCKIAKQLISRGADIDISDASGISCLDIAKDCQYLNDLLTKPVEIDSVPILIPWTSYSVKHRDVLSKVVRQQECKIKNQIWYHRKHIASGSFGDIFVGVNEKDGREVAVKRIVKSRLQRPEDKREIINLTAVADCKQIVSYISFIEEKDFAYIILELMEGNLEDYLKSFPIDDTEAIALCQDVVEGVNFLHKHKIVHRDLKPQNILYKLHPERRMKIADFGLSRAYSSTSTTVYSTRVGTRCWMAPEVLKPKNKDEIFVAGSDVFSCGLLLHYILSAQKHPFTPLDCENKGSPEETIKTEANIMNGEMKGWDHSLHPEASQLIKRMLESNLNERPTAGEAKDHPLFWSNKKKIDFLKAVGNQKEFECPRAKRKLPLTQVEIDLDNNFSAIVKHRSWNSSKHNSMPDIYKTMTKGKGRNRYDTSSVVELVRFIRNVYEHYRENTFNTTIGIEQLLFEDFVFLKNFPDLVMEIYKAVKTHGWDKTRADIEKAIEETRFDEMKEEVIKEESMLTLPTTKIDPKFSKKFEKNVKRQKINKARSLALEFMSKFPCCIRVIPYEREDKDEKQLTMCLYVDTDGQGVPENVKESANKMFSNYHIEFHDLQKRPSSKIVDLSARKTEISAEEKEQRNSLSRKIGENLYLFIHRMNVTAVCASYKVTNFKEHDILCVTVFVLGKKRIPAGETDIKNIKKQYGSLFGHAEFDVEEGYYRPATGPQLASYALPLQGGIGIGVENVPGAGTLGGFLKDERGECYILSNEHVLHPTDAKENKMIVQPSQHDHENILEEYKKKVAKAEKAMQLTFNLTPEQEREAEQCRQNLAEAKSKLKRSEENKPRQIATYFSGLRGNVKINIGESEVEFYVDAAIAKLENVEESYVSESRGLYGQLYGFEDRTLDGEIITPECFRELLQREDSDLRFMKIGRTTGVTKEGIVDSVVKEIYVRIIDVEKYRNTKPREDSYAPTFYHIPFYFHEYCMEHSGNKLETSDERYDDFGNCMECHKKLQNDGTIKECWARNCLVVRKSGSYFSDSGDSGALVFGNNGKAWGLLFGNFEALGRDISFALISPLSVALKALEAKTEKKFELWRKEQSITESTPSSE